MQRLARTVITLDLPVCINNGIHRARAGPRDALNRYAPILQKLIHSAPAKRAVRPPALQREVMTFPSASALPSVSASVPAATTAARGFLETFSVPIRHLLA